MLEYGASAVLLDRRDLERSEPTESLASRDPPLGETRKIEAYRLPDQSSAEDRTEESTAVEVKRVVAGCDVVFVGK